MVAVTNDLPWENRRWPQKKILMLAGDFVVAYDAMVPFQMLQMVGHEVYAVCPEGQARDSVRNALLVFGGEQTYSERPECNVAADAASANAHVDGNLVTAAAWPAQPEWIRKRLEVLGTRIES